MDLPQGPHTQLFLDPLGARGALVASAQATESCPSIFWVLIWTIASFRGSQWSKVERRMSVLVIAELSLSKSVSRGSLWFLCSWTWIPRG